MEVEKKAVLTKKVPMQVMRELRCNDVTEACEILLDFAYRVRLMLHSAVPSCVGAR